MDPDLRVAQESARRWQTRQVEREEQRSAIEEGLIASVEPPERIQKRLDRLAAAAVGRKGSAGGPGPRAGRPQAGLVETIGLERVLGKADFLGMDFLETALAVSRFVGRINFRTRPGRTEGFGTGFMVSPRLLLTNNHVLRTKGDALYSEVEFDYQYDRHDRLLPVVVYGLEPETFFLTSRELDFTLVAVRESSLSGIGIGRYGWSPLIGAEGKCLLGDPLNIVQHPKGEAKQIVLRSNQLVDLFGDFAHYVADTEPGSSGSPIYNDEWEVVCLHHSGVPKTEDRNLVAKDGSVWRQGMDPDDLDWVANEGIRMSSIVAHLKKERLTGEQARLREELLNSEPPDPLEAAAMAREAGGVPNATPAGDRSYAWTIPLRVTVELGAPSQAPGSPATPPPVAFDAQPARPSDLVPGGTISEVPTPVPADEAVSIDPDYGNREGYDPDFLGPEAGSVPLPQLSEAMMADATVNREAEGADEHVLPYHHFSVVMSRARRLAYFTAVNVDGAKRAHEIDREEDRWFLDPRIGEDEQAGEAIYAANPLDRGHLVRRLDPAWGVDFDQAKVANDDTFHFTNCCPQHEKFNRNKTTWAGMEDYVLNNAVAQRLRVSVFTGPVFDEGDPEYRGVRLPRQFWKVVVMARDDGALSATAYLLSQESLLQDLEGFSFGAHKTFQIAVRQVEELTGLDFGDLKDADPLKAPGAVATEGLLGGRQIASPEEAAF